MKLEDQVCSLELAKKLKEFGVKQDAYFSHNPYGIFITRQIKEDELWFVSAFTVAELGEMLPFRLRLPDNDHWLRCSKSDDFWEVRYVTYHKFEGAWHIVQGKTEADARAKMLIHLIEKGIVKP